MSAGVKFQPFAAAPYNGGVNFSSDTLKVMLTNTSPAATATQYSDISASELANGAGYTTGGAAITSVTSTQTGGTYILKGTGPTFTSSGSMGPFRYAVVYDSTPTTKYLVGAWDYGSSITPTSGQTFQFAIDGTNGLLQNA
jgi:hypothetical protein